MVSRLNDYRLPCLRDILSQLADQIVRPLERSRVAQPTDEVHRERLAVQIALEADQMDLLLSHKTLRLRRF